jgi:hypothetical protein
VEVRIVTRQRLRRVEPIAVVLHTKVKAPIGFAAEHTQGVGVRVLARVDHQLAQRPVAQCLNRLGLARHLDVEIHLLPRTVRGEDLHRGGQAVAFQHLRPQFEHQPPSALDRSLQLV